MPLPVVAIVGRPNVGKSSLLNCLTRRRISIVDPTAGVTRDRVSAVCQADETYFELVDTGGYGIEDPDRLDEHIRGQILQAVRQAELTLFVVDVLEGLMPLDMRVAELLRQHGCRVLLVANKADHKGLEAAASEFYKLGFDEPICISAVHGRGRAELLERIVAQLRTHVAGPPPEPVMKLAIVGKRNVGKSTFINALAGQERVIVSEIPGTTRDAIDVQFEKDGRTFTAIDTAGVRKKRKIADSVEFYSYARATRSIRRADVVLLLIDATEPVSQVDKKLARFIAEEYKPCVLVINKWDLAKSRAATDDYGAYLTSTLPEIDYAPIAFTTAKTGRNVQATIDTAIELFKQARSRIPTGRLNQVLQAALAARGPSARRSTKPVKIYYATQVATCPPTIVLSVNDPGAVTAEYQRFLINRLREGLPFAEIPIRLLLKAHHAKRSAGPTAGSSRAEPDTSEPVP